MIGEIYDIFLYPINKFHIIFLRLIAEFRRFFFTQPFGNLRVSGFVLVTYCLNSQFFFMRLLSKICNSFFLRNILMNFEIFFHDRITQFIIYFLRLTDKIYDFFPCDQLPKFVLFLATDWRILQCHLETD